MELGMNYNVEVKVTVERSKLSYSYSECGHSFIQGDLREEISFRSPPSLLP